MLPNRFIIILSYPAPWEWAPNGWTSSFGGAGLAIGAAPSWVVIVPRIIQYAATPGIPQAIPRGAGQKPREDADTRADRSTHSVTQIDNSAVEPDTAA